MRRTTKPGGSREGDFSYVGTKKKGEKKRLIDITYYKEDELAAVCGYIGHPFFLFVRPDYIQTYTHRHIHKGDSLFSTERPFPSKRKKTPTPKKRRRHVCTYLKGRKIRNYYVVITP